MKKTTLLLLAFSLNAYSAKVIFTNNNEEADITGNASIDIQTGDVLVETSAPKLIVGGNAILSVFPNTYQANDNQIISMSYTVAHGENCVGTTNRGSVSNWTMPLNSSDGTHSNSVNVGSTFPIDFTVTCDNKLGAGTVTDTARIVETSGSPAVAPSVTLRVNGSASNTSVTAGSSVALTYSITNNDLPCTFTSTPVNSSWNALNSSSSSTVNFNTVISTSSTFGISCTNSDGLTDSDSRIISITSSAACQSHPPPAGTSEQFGQTYVGVTGQQFGDATSSSANFSIDKNKYVALQVTAPTSLYLRKNSFEQPTANFTPASYTVSLSKCPGDFNVSSNDVGRGRCVVGGQQAGGSTTPVLRWTTKTNPTSTDLALKCVLDPGDTYYLNIIHATTPPYSQTVCSDSTKCGVLFTELIDN
ncbi:hypothetical protein [Marinicella litoralis]|uniref:Ig-like domain-containing protein n=1 Tax=Marinicella litoralis TaxID=644220 RepID=A0A4R6XRE2_9GAMM|nr:hypothetical protein [Marinicella litoralis]TDR20810.1 hypothetical protein C8D91_1788 [Marinicella litoralis]